MLVSAISSLSSAKNSYLGGNTAQSAVKNSHYDHYNYFGANKENNNNQNAVNEMFHKIALWKDFCEKHIITDESQKETFNYLAQQILFAKEQNKDAGKDNDL